MRESSNSKASSYGVMSVGNIVDCLVADSPKIKSSAVKSSTIMYMNMFVR